MCTLLCTLSSDRDYNGGRPTARSFDRDYNGGRPLTETTMVVRKWVYSQLFNNSVISKELNSQTCQYAQQAHKTASRSLTSRPGECEHVHVHRRTWSHTHTQTPARSLALAHALQKKCESFTSEKPTNAEPSRFLNGSLRTRGMDHSAKGRQPLPVLAPSLGCRLRLPQLRK